MSDYIAKQRRWRSTASTWVRKAVALLRHIGTEGGDADRWLAGYEAARLASDLLAAVEELVPLLNTDEDYQLDELRKQARTVARALRNHALAPKLAQTKGRTADEAEAFARKAAELA